MQKKIISQVTYKNYYWSNLASPTREKINLLGEKFSFHSLDLEDALQRIQSPKLDFMRDYAFLILHFPYYNKNKKKLRALELDIFISSNYLVTIHEGKFDYLNDLFKRCSLSKRSAAYFLNHGPARFLYTILDNLVDTAFPLLEGMGRQIDEIDRMIFEMDQKQAVEKINLVRRDVVIFHTMIKPQISIFHDLERTSVNFLDGKLSTYWANLTDHTQRIRDRLEDYRELIEGLSEANESLLSFRTNEIIKILTIFSVVLMPLTLLSGIYGMNLSYLPLAKHPLALFFITIFMFALVASMVVYFKYKKWI